MLLRLLYRYYHLIFLMAFPGVTLNAQDTRISESEFHEIKAYFDHSIDPDFNLMNGREYHLLYSATSHPYFDSDRYRFGSAGIKGKDFEQIPINFDICNQQVILQDPGSSGQVKQIVLNKEMVDYFILDGNMFRKMSFPETGTSFFQVVSEGEIACYLLWEKNLYRSTTSSTTPYKYSKQSRRIYIEKDSQLFYIRNRASFISVFDEANQNEISRFIRQEKIRFRSASGMNLDNLMKFCIGLQNTS